MATKMALCVGINYEGTSAQLGGCINDAQDWTRVLTARGYEVRTLLERDATAANILGALETMRAKVGARAKAVYTYSGHGTFTPDLDGDEVDGFDEAFVPYDYRTAGLITDDDMYRVAGRRRFGSRWTTISDSCHSGTLTRFVASPLHAGSVTKTPRFLPPEQAITDERTLDVAREAVTAALYREVPTFNPDRETADVVVRPRGISRSSGVLLSGCKDAEVSYDAVIGGRGRGAFTAAALTALDGRPSTIAAWHAGIRTALPSYQFPQTPQLQASSSQRRWAPLD